MEREEQPGVVDLDIEGPEAPLIIGAVAVSAVDVGLLREATGIVFLQILHQSDGFLVVC